MKNQNLFMNELKEYCNSNPEINHIEFFGSVVDRPDEWIKGKSDIDIFVFGNNISSETKRKTHKIFWDLDEKYQLELEKPAMIHPLIFFIDSPSRQSLYLALKNNKYDFPHFRKFFKQIAPPANILKQLSPFIPNPLWKLA